VKPDLCKYPLIVFCGLIVISANIFAQADIRNANQVPEIAADASLVYEFQALQQEIQILRGQLEKQGYEIKRLKQQRLDDYLDLDKRITVLAEQKNALPVATIATPQEGNATPAATTTSTIGAITNPVTAVNNEQSKTLYNDAIDLLLNKQDYTGAQTKFSEYLRLYPKGQYTPNVYYWQGQILFAGSKKEKAAEVFEKLITEYPTNLKVPDAKFKLARIYFDQGKKKQAKQILDQVAISDSDAALLAKSFISKNYP
jgi:tol-pal system protein YbgF